MGKMGSCLCQTVAPLTPLLYLYVRWQLSYDFATSKPV
jgi:hypothetical protein